MQMIDLMKRLAELDASNLNKKQDVEGDISECGMMGSMPSTQSHTPASISMTAASGEELSGMLKDIMTLAGRPEGQQSPIGTPPATAMIDIEPAGDGMGPPGMDATSTMRSVLDKMNDADDDEEMKEYDNEPNPTTTGYGANVPSGDDLHKEKSQYPAAQPGDNPMAATFESLMAEYKKFVSEEQGVAEGKKKFTYKVDVPEGTGNYLGGNVLKFVANNDDEAIEIAREKKGRNLRRHIGYDNTIKVPMTSKEKPLSPWYAGVGGVPANTGPFKKKKQGVAEGYEDDSKEREENLRYSRSRNPVADAIRKKLNPNQKEQNKEQGVAESKNKKS